MGAFDAETINGWINSASQNFGVSPNYLTTSARLEGQDLFSASNGQNIFTFKPGTAPAFAQYGLDTVNGQINAAGAYAAQNRTTLMNTLGRPVSDFEVYLGHFFGAGGYKKALNNLDAPVSDIIPGTAPGGGNYLKSLGPNATVRDYINATQQRYLKAGGTDSQWGGVNGPTGKPDIIGAILSPSLSGTIDKLTGSNAGTVGIGAATGNPPKADGPSIWTWAEHQIVRVGVLLLGLVFIVGGLSMFALGGISREVETARAFKRAKAVAREGRSEITVGAPPAPKPPAAPSPSTPKGGGGAPPSPQTKAKADSGAKPSPNSKSMKMLKAVQTRRKATA